jgi:general secretion pathway protein J
MIPAPHTETDEAGFTLVELLVAIALLALMATYALSGLSYMNNFDRVTHRIERQAEVEAAARHLEKTLGDTRVVFGAEETVTAQIEFEGQENSIEVVSILDRALVRGGLFRLRYGLQQSGASADNQGAVLSVWREVFRPRSGSTKEDSIGEPTILMDGVQALHFHYFGSADPEKEPAWRDYWPKGEFLPKLISVDVEFPPGDARRWPQLIIPIQASR